MARAKKRSDAWRVAYRHHRLQQWHLLQSVRLPRGIESYYLWAPYLASCEPIRFPDIPAVFPPWFPVDRRRARRPRFSACAEARASRPLHVQHDQPGAEGRPLGGVLPGSLRGTAAWVHDPLQENSLMSVGVTGSKLDAIFYPQSIAVVGASTRPGTVGNDIFRNLLFAEFNGSVYPVNPKAKAVLGVHAYRLAGRDSRPGRSGRADRARRGRAGRGRRGDRQGGQGAGGDLGRLQGDRAGGRGAGGAASRQGPARPAFR